MPRFHAELLVLIACTAFANASMAAPGISREASAREWLSDQLKLKPFALVPKRHFFACKIVRQPRFSENELDQLRREVGNKIDHPRRPELQRKEAMLDGKGNEILRLWYDDVDLWRLNSERSGLPAAIEFVDLGKNGSDIWSLTPTQLSVQSSQSPPNPGRDFQDTFNQKVANTIDLFFSGGLSDLILADGTVVDVRVLESDFVGRVRTNQASWYVRFSWNGPLNTFVLVSRSLTDPAKGPSPIEWMFRDWEKRSGETAICRSVTLSGTKVEFATTYSLLEFSETTSEVVRRVAATPSREVPDAVRGDLKYTAVYDGRASPPRLTETLRDGSHRTWEAAVTASGGSQWWHVLAIVSVLLGVSVIVALRWNQRAS